MFTKFAIAYRNLWHKEFKDDRYREYAKKEWEKHLQAFSDATITTVTEICEKQCEMPPTMAQFIGLCKNEVNRHIVKNIEPNRKRNIETATFHLNKIKEILNTRR